MKDEDLYKGLYAKDPTAFEIVMSIYNKLLWAIAGSILNGVGTNEDIEECIADTYFKLWENPKLFNAKRGTLKSFLAVIAKNKALDKYRKLSKQKLFELDDEISTRSTDNDLLEYILTKEKNVNLYNALNSLKEPEKEIMVRRYLFEEKPSYIAKKLSIPVKEVENRIYQSKLKLKKYFSSQEVRDNEI